METVRTGSKIGKLTVEGTVGQRFGMLTALQPTEERSRKGSTIWRRRYDCGNEVLTDISPLTRENRKSYGCLRHPSLKNFKGKRFGKLTVLGYAGKEAGMHRWRCRCDYGKEAVVGQSLPQGDSELDKVISGEGGSRMSNGEIS